MLVLVVDDDPLACEAIARLIRTEGHHVITATDYDEAMALIKQYWTMIHVAVIDHFLNGHKGRDVALATPRATACILTSGTSVEEIRAAYQAQDPTTGFIAFRSKPLRWDHEPDKADKEEGLRQLLQRVERSHGHTPRGGKLPEDPS